VLDCYRGWQSHVAGLLLTHRPSNALLHSALYSSLAVKIPVEHTVSVRTTSVNLTASRYSTHGWGRDNEKWKLNERHHNGELGVEVSDSMRSLTNICVQFNSGVTEQIYPSTPTKTGITHDNHVTLLATIYSRTNTTHVFILTTCFGRNAMLYKENSYLHLH
jgi:hypothetical protein